MPPSIGTPWITHKSSFAWPKQGITGASLNTLGPGTPRGSVMFHTCSQPAHRMASLGGMWPGQRVFLQSLGGSRSGKAFGGHCAKGWIEEGDRGKGLSSQSNKGPLAKWWWPDRLLVIRSRWKGLFLDSFKVCFPTSCPEPTYLPNHQCKVLSHPGWYETILREHPHAGIVAWDKGCYRKLLPSEQPPFLPCSLRRLCYVVNTSYWPDIPQPRFKELLVSFQLLSPLGAWPHLWDWVSFLSTCPDFVLDTGD